MRILPLVHPGITEGEWRVHMAVRNGVITVQPGEVLTLHPDLKPTLSGKPTSQKQLRGPALCDCKFCIARGEKPFRPPPPAPE